MTVLSKNSRFVQRDVDFWSKKHAEQLALVDHKLVSLKLKEYIMYQGSSWNSPMKILAALGPFACMDNVPHSLSQCVLEIAKYHPNLLGNAAETIIERALTAATRYSDTIYNFCELSAMPAFFVTYADAVQTFMPIFHNTWKEKSNSYKFSLVMFLLAYKLHNPQSEVPYSFEELLKECSNNDRIRVWVSVHIMELLCSWWECKWIVISKHEVWNMLVDLLTKFGIFTPPRIVNMLTQVEKEMRKQGFHDLAHNLNVWLQNMSIFFQAERNFTDIKFYF